MTKVSAASAQSKNEMPFVKKSRPSPKHRHTMVSLRPKEVTELYRSPSLEFLYQPGRDDDQTDSVFYDTTPPTVANHHTVLRVTPVDADQFGKRSHLVETFGMRSLKSWKPVPAPRPIASGDNYQLSDGSTQSYLVVTLKSESGYCSACSDLMPRIAAYHSNSTNQLSAGVNRVAVALSLKSANQQ